VRDQKPTVSIVPDADGTDVSFCFISQHFVLGYFRQVPAGLISGHQRTCAILIASPLVEAHRRPLDRYRKSGLTVVKYVSASQHDLRDAGKRPRTYDSSVVGEVLQVHRRNAGRAHQ